MTAAFDPWKSVPPPWRAAVLARLEPGEEVVALLEPDLDERLRFASSAVVLTTRRVIELTGDPTGREKLIERSWPLATIAALKAHEHDGLGTLDLLGADARLASWRYTIGRSAAAHGLAEHLDIARRGPRQQTNGESAGEDAPRICPSCGEVIPTDQTECPACTQSASQRRQVASSLWRLVMFARPRLPAAIAALALTFLGNAAALIYPALTAPLVDDVLRPKMEGVEVPARLAELLLAAMVGSALLAWVLSWTYNYVTAWLSERISADLRNRAYAHLQSLSLEFFGGKRTGDLITRISTDSDRINNFISGSVLTFISDVLTITMTTVILFWWNPWLAFVTLCPIPAATWLVYRVRGRLRRGYSNSFRVWGELTSVLADTIPGIRVVKAFAQESREIRRFRQANDHVLAADDRVNRLWAFVGPTVTLFTELGVVIIWAFGTWWIFQGTLTVGVLWAFMIYSAKFYARMQSLSAMISAVQRAGASAHRMFEILDRVSTVPEPVKPVHPGTLRGDIELLNVGFQYGHRPVLNDVSLSIRSGEMIGLVGPSGAGKSTLINLLCRFYDVKEGAIRADGVDIRSYPVEEYRRNIGIVLQDPFLFYGTIAENITYGRPDASRAQIIEAAKAARAHEFILGLTDGYDSLVGERGQTLSGGERQRVSIARALLIDPRILILDEATSSVDTETERQIQEALENLIEGRTTIAIAHRLSTLRRADRLVVLEHGHVVEVGPHQQLLDQGGLYAKLHQAQLDLAAAAE